MPGSDILLVDDDEATVNLIRLTLQLEGFSIRTARNRDEALQVASAHMPDLVIMDYLMGGLDAEAFVTQLRGAGFAGTVLLCTAYSGPLDNVPAQEVVSKPFDPAVLAERVRVLLELV